MSKEKPLVSVVMPAYNAEKYISEAIESILNQTFKDFEFIIIDDGSTDRTWEIVQEHAKKDKRIVPIKNERNLKICKTLNKGISLSKGKYIVRMDSDDWSFPDRIKKQVGFMEDNENIVVSGGHIEVTDEKLATLYLRKYPILDRDIRKKMFIYNPFAHPSVIFRSEVVKSENPIYDHSFYDAEDYDLYFRLGRVGKLANIGEVLLKYRVSSNSVSYRRHVRQGLVTLSVRFRATFRYRYKIPLHIILLQPIELLATLLLPASFKYKIFSLARKYI